MFQHTARAVTGFALLGVLAGCARPTTPSTGGSAPPPPRAVKNDAGELQADYVFYPAYGVYYSGRQRHYVFLEKDSWVTRSAPPGVSATVLFASPSVQAGTDHAPSF